MIAYSYWKTILSSELKKNLSFKAFLTYLIPILAQSMIGIPGIARRKSNVGQTGVELRGSYNSQHSNRTLNTTFESSQDELLNTGEGRRTISTSRPTS